MKLLKILIIILLLSSCDKSTSNNETVNQLKGTPNITTKTVLSGRGIIWGFDTLPLGKIIFTEKAGGLFIYDSLNGSVSPINGLPTNVQSNGQGGWLDVCSSPNIKNDNLIYVTYSITNNFLQLARFSLNNNNATNWQILKTTTTTSSWGGHYGSRICFGNDGKLYWSVGEGGNGSYGGAASPHQNAQNLSSLWGKIHRLNIDGSNPNDNPTIAGNPPSSIYSYGHRNPQGLCFKPNSNSLFSAEHGPKGGCELNLIEPAKNYGWPLYCDGVNYDDTKISDGHNGTGITAPLKSYTPALAPGGICFINHNSYRDWNGNLLISSLGRRQILMVSFQNNLPVKDTVLFNNIGRVRNVKQTSSGKILFSIDDGRLMEMVAQ
jgi:glucose/arabinose dehydrogenase